jgi:hypothetical protein
MSCSTTGPFPKGSRPVVEMNFTDYLGAANNPADIDVTTRDPSGDILTYDESGLEIFQGVPAVTGEWFFQFPANLTEVGWWYVYINGDGAVQEVRFKIAGVHVTV